MGRPKKEVDLGVVAEMAGRGCTAEEVAARLGVSKATLRRHPDFDEVFRKGLAEAGMSVRSVLYESAMEGNVAAAIYCSKMIHAALLSYTGDDEKEVAEDQPSVTTFQLPDNGR